MRLMRNAHAPHIDFNEFRGMIKSNPKILPCDIDMIIERKGKFLVGEWKREGESMSQGQVLLLQALAKQSQFVVVVIHGHTDDDTVVFGFDWINKRGALKKWAYFTLPSIKRLGDLKNFIGRWYEYADRG